MPPLAPRPRLPPSWLLPCRRRLLSTTQPHPLPPSRTQTAQTSPQAAAAAPPAPDDFYSLLLSQPLAHPTPQSLSKHATLQVANSLSDAATSPPITAPETTTTTPPKISFSMPLAGPSARMRGLARGEKGLDRPPEPDNCCMSGCVNCVWEAYREEVEEWAVAKRRREREEERGAREREKGMRAHADVRYVGTGKEEEQEQAGGGVGEADGGGGEEVDQEGLFDEVPVGMREFMATEKRLRERKQRRLAMGEG